MAEQKAAEEVEEVTAEPAVVNVAHLMAYVDEQREEGNAAFRNKRHAEALAAWQRALDACEQADGKPMLVADVETVLRVRSVLHSNRGQALIEQEWWRRAVKELSEAVQIDPSNAKALWRRYRCHRHLAGHESDLAEVKVLWAAAQADLEALSAPELQEAAGPLLAGAGLGPDQLEKTLGEIRAKVAATEAQLADTFEERVEEQAYKGIEKLRERFEEELAGEIAALMTREGGDKSVQFVANVYQIDEDDASILCEWIQTAMRMHDELGSSRAGLEALGL